MRYVGILEETGKCIDESDAYEYAKSHLDEMPQEDKNLFVDFFFSGNWVKENEMRSRKRRSYEIAEGLRDEPI